VGLYNASVGKYWVRCLTPEECGLIQGFPADYAWQGSVKDKITQIGNAVPPPLATAIAHLIEKATFSKSPQKVGVDPLGEDSDDE
jgi:site-specific DNA-cytosine methylase